MRSTDLSYLNSSSYKWSLCIIMAIFLIAFLTIFLPFGVSNYNPNHEYTLTWMLDGLSFSLVTFFVSGFNEFILKGLFIKRLNFRIMVFWSIWSFLFYGTANFLNYNFIGNWHDFSLESGILFILQISSVLIFPMAGVMFFFRFKSLRKQYDTIVTDLKHKINPTQLITFSGQGQGETIVLSTANFLFAQSQDNYVELHYLNNGKTSKHLLRSTLNNLQKTLSLSFINRCHRSFMVNLYQVQSIKGSLINLRLTLNGVDQSIPVSKTYASTTLLQLRNYKSFS